MALQYTAAIRNAWCADLNTTLGVSARLNIYSGSPPANVAASPTGVLLSSGCRGNAAGFGTIVAGVLTASAITPDPSAVGVGIAGYFRWLDASNNVVTQGTVSVTSGSGDLKLNNITIAEGDPVAIGSWSITAPGT